VRNPLANRTRLKFARSEGRLQAPTRTNLNLRFGKNFKLPREGQVIETALDIFNVFNDDTPLFFNNSTRDDLSSFGTYSTFRAAPRGLQLSIRYRF
jgi:hypothetical protein